MFLKVKDQGCGCQILHKQITDFSF